MIAFHRWILLLLVAFVPQPPIYADSGIPNVIESQYRKMPIWVAASHALDETGTFKTEIYGEQLSGSLNSHFDFLAKYSTIDASDCIAKRQVVFSEAPDIPPRSLRESTRENQRIIRLRVTGKEMGLHWSHYPATLFRALPVETIHGAVLDREVVYFAFPIGDMEIRGYQYCKTDHRFPQPPGVGDEVILFVEERILRHHDTYIELDSEPEIIILRANGTVDLAPQYVENVDDAFTSLPQSEATIHQYLAALANSSDPSWRFQ
ncbi:MAG: hypothetical protein AAGD38_11765 [Acidobacteriota bacterium]